MDPAYLTTLVILAYPIAIIVVFVVIVRFVATTFAKANVREQARAQQKQKP